MERNLSWGILILLGLCMIGCRQGYLDGSSAEAPTITATERVHVSLWIQRIGKPWLTNHGELLNLKVKLSNTGTEKLVSTGSNPINIGEILVNADGSIANHDYGRNKLPKKLEAGKTITTVISIPTQQFKGNSINIQAVQEGVAWLDGVGSNVITLGPLTACPANGAMTICDANWQPLPARN